MNIKISRKVFWVTVILCVIGLNRLYAYCSDAPEIKENMQVMLEMKERALDFDNVNMKNDNIIVASTNSGLGGESGDAYTNEYSNDTYMIYIEHKNGAIDVFEIVGSAVRYTGMNPSKLSISREILNIEKLVSDFGINLDRSELEIDPYEGMNEWANDGAPLGTSPENRSIGRVYNEDGIRLMPEDKEDYKPAPKKAGEWLFL